MSTNRFSDGSPVEITVPSGGCVSGKGVLINGVFCIPETTGNVGDTVAAHLVGIWDITSDTGTAWAFGDVIYWDNTAKVATKTTTSNTKIGQCMAAKTSAAVTGRVRIQPAF